MASHDSESVDEELTFGEDLVQSPPQRAPETSSIDFDGVVLRMHEDVKNGNGGQVWPAGRILARYLLWVRRDELRDSTMFVDRADVDVL